MKCWCPVANVHQCLSCSKVYKSKYSLKRHHVLECGVEPRFPCPYCMKRCRQKTHLKSHVFRAHKCPRCMKVFTKKNNLSRHYTRECGQEPSRQCPYCPFATYRKNSLKDHIFRKHHVEVELPRLTRRFGEKNSFRCSKCGKRYKSKSYLNHHMNNECFQVPNKRCPYCYIYVDGFMKISSECYTNVCNVCNRRYKHVQSLKFHQKHECGKEPKYICQMEGCSYRTKLKGNFKSHLVKKHKCTNVNLQ
ncbi:PREDICTED: zinc finger protein 236-like [Nicrophorus vespilloides]|uniref:Zinc finger protein 236-like n=1 Tax=Nicrophorus vespilloides TaxID=110193 RepID=A0ABM1N9I9_NICVS|nr:PREDICTED: zinc finger protein 236-like [Nicrophorus vespilloides]